jgi:hypothetical protein
MLEQKVLSSILHSRGAYERIRKFLDPKDFSASGWAIGGQIEEFYKQDPLAKSVDTEVLCGRISRAMASSKQSDMLSDIVRNLKKELSSDNTAQEYLELKRQVAADRFAAAVGARSPQKTIDALAEEYETLRRATALDTEPAEHIEDDWQKLIEGELDERTKIRILPGALNTLVGGGLRRGDSVVLFGRPNSGKSLFCINASAGFIKQGLKVLWIENEDRGNKTKLRFGRRLIGWSDSQMRANPAKAAELLRGSGAERFIYASLTPGTPLEVESLVAEHGPDVFIVNQIRNLNAKAEGFTRQLDLLAQKMRSIGKKYNALVISVTQAHAPSNDQTGMARDKPILYMEDVDSSRTGIAASADVMIGYGTSRDMRASKMALINVCKNKNGPEEHIHCSVDIEIDKLISAKGDKP